MIANPPGRLAGLRSWSTNTPCKGKSINIDMLLLLRGFFIPRHEKKKQK